MAQEDEGWPLGLLQPVNARIHNIVGSTSFNTLLTLTASPFPSTHSSSHFDLDTESTGSFFGEQSTTLGSLMGVSSIVEVSRRSLRGTKTEQLMKSKKKRFKFRSWLSCLGSRSINPEAAERQKNNPPSLGQFLAVERRAANENRKNQSLPIYDPHDELALAETDI